MSCTVTALLDVARAELGTCEQPPGSNRTRYGAWYGMDGQPWCAMFVSWCAARAGAADIVPRHAYTPSGAAWFQQRRQWGRAPRPGAIVYFQWPGMGRIAHVGIVESVRADGAVVVLEGNTNGAGSRTGGTVMRHVRRANIAGYGYPRFAAATAAAAARAATVASRSGGRPASARPTEPRLAVDGELGPLTVRALQRALSVPMDGEIGSQTVRALQRRVGAPVDGELGPVTVRALQRRVGAAPDGEWGPGTTSALQRALNRGTF